MSRFLAPIHTWLFNKINLAQDLEKEVVKVHSNKYNKEAVDIEEEAKKIYGDYIPNEPIENLIDTDNIHGWLQERIKEVESRSSYIISRYYEIFKEESKELTKNVYINQAKQCAINENNKIGSPEDVYMTLNNYILSGMPCDRVNSVVEKSEDYIIYEKRGCIHKSNYELGKADIEYMNELRELWIRTFIENLPENYAYEKQSNEDITINTIKKL